MFKTYNLSDKDLKKKYNSPEQGPTSAGNQPFQNNDGTDDSKSKENTLAPKDSSRETVDAAPNKGEVVKPWPSHLEAADSGQKGAGHWEINDQDVKFVEANPGSGYDNFTEGSQLHVQHKSVEMSATGQQPDQNRIRKTVSKHTAGSHVVSVPRTLLHPGEDNRDEAKMKIFRKRHSESYPFAAEGGQPDNREHLDPQQDHSRKFSSTNVKSPNNAEK